MTKYIKSKSNTIWYPLYPFTRACLDKMSKWTGIQGPRGILKIFRTFRRARIERQECISADSNLHISICPHVVVFQPPWTLFALPSVWLTEGGGKKGLSYMRRIDCYIAFVLSVVLFAGRLTGMDSPPCGIIIGVPRRNAVRRYKQAEWINGSSQVSWMLC